MAKEEEKVEESEEEEIEKSVEEVAEEAEAEVVAEVKEKMAKVTAPERHKELVAAELELRRYVKRTGGFRKDLPAKNQRRAKVLMRLLGRREPKWNQELIGVAFSDKLVGDVARRVV